MAAKDDEKARLYNRIVRLTPDSVLLHRMQVHGFWPNGVGLPADPAAEAAERARLEKELADLRKAGSTVKDPDKALAAERKRRWEESKKRRAERKAKRLAEQQQRRERWAAIRQASVTHAGVGVSTELNDVTSDAAALQARGLPVLHNGPALAAAMKITLGTLRWLTFHRRGATLVHYHRYEVAKKTGGARCISAPKPALKAAQYWVHDHILSRLPVEPHAHGFVPERSILTNAAPHAKRQVVINLDLKDFFPSITFARVRGLFRHMGYGGQVATLLALLCTEPPRVPVELAGRRYFLALGDRALPQGACTSPAITNVLCRKLDTRLAGLARKLGFAYTRYADDLTFSGDDPARVGWLFRSVRMVLKAEGLTEHPTKTRVMRRASRQEVTGIVVNDRPALSRDQRRELRAILHNAARHGLPAQNRDNRPDFAGYLRGRVAFACMVEPQRAGAWQAALDAALANW
jgi:retron-type reverse transcriptase